MDICEGCQSREGCQSPCNQNILPIGNGREENECPYFDECDRCKKHMANKPLEPTPRARG